MRGTWHASWHTRTRLRSIVRALCRACTYAYIYTQKLRLSYAASTFRYVASRKDRVEIGTCRFACCVDALPRARCTRARRVVNVRKALPCACHQHRPSPCEKATLLCCRDRSRTASSSPLPATVDQLECRRRCGFWQRRVRHGTTHATAMHNSGRAACMAHACTATAAALPVLA